MMNSNYCNLTSFKQLQFNLIAILLQLITLGELGGNVVIRNEISSALRRRTDRSTSIAPHPTPARAPRSTNRGRETRRAPSALSSYLPQTSQVTGHSLPVGQSQDFAFISRPGPPAGGTPSTVCFANSALSRYCSLSSLLFPPRKKEVERGNPPCRVSSSPTFGGPPFLTDAS